MPFGILEETGRPVTIKDEGMTLTTNVGSIDTVGAGITTTTIGDAATMNVPGASAANMAYDETPTGVINGINKTFTLAHTPAPAGSLILQLNQGFPIPGGEDYSISGNTITMIVAPPTGSVLRAKQYQY